MITFVCCLIALIVGYFIYGKFIERIFGIDAKRQTPAYTHQDGVDYIPMPTWKVFMIQFLNIAGLGPIFGAIMGAKFGTASFLWIVLGSDSGGIPQRRSETPDRKRGQTGPAGLPFPLIQGIQGPARTLQRDGGRSTQECRRKDHYKHQILHTLY